jgi:hypothetical protein
MEITRVADEELKRLAEEQGPSSRAANILFRLREKRAKDRQVFVWQVGPYCFIGPAPDAETEMAMIELAESEEADGDEDDEE